MTMQSSKYTQAERDRIMSEARRNVMNGEVRAAASTRREQHPVRRDQPTIMHKTRENARVEPEPEPEPVVLAAASSEQQWWEWVDERVDKYHLDPMRAGIGDAIGELLGDECNERRREVELLRREITLIREEAKVERGLIKLREKVERAIERQPNFERELKDLRGELAAARGELDKTRKTLSKERVTLSVLKHQVAEMEKHQRRDRRTTATLQRTVTTMTVDFDLSGVGASTRQAMAEAQQHQPRADNNLPWWIEIVQ
jgi:hypothetical protein